MGQTIEPATEAAIEKIEEWLNEEEVLFQKEWYAFEKSGYTGNEPVRGFRCNWDSSRKRWEEGQSRIDVLFVDDQEVGFLCDRDILEIKPDCRGLGYGRVLAQFMLDLAFEQGLSVVEIEIAPSTARPFWRSMGFTPISGRQGSGGGLYAYRVLSRTYSLGDGARVDYSVSFFTQNERFEDDPTPFRQFSGLGERLPNGVVQLPERAFCHRPEDAQHVDYFLKVELGGREIYFDKVRHARNEALGVEYGDDDGIYFLDHIKA